MAATNRLCWLKKKKKKRFSPVGSVVFGAVHEWVLGCLPCSSRWGITNKKQLVLLIRSGVGGGNRWHRPRARQSFDWFLIRLVPGQTCVINWVESSPWPRRCKYATCAVLKFTISAWSTRDIWWYPEGKRVPKRTSGKKKNRKFVWRLTDILGHFLSFVFNSLK